MATKRRSGGGWTRFVLGFLTAVALLTLGCAAYFTFGRPPVAVSDAPFPFERDIVQLPLDARIDRETKPAPFGTSEDVFEAGAHVYKSECASCHGVPGHDVPFAKYMYPSAPQLWKKHTRGNVVGVSDDPPGETYWKVANGIRLSGMPSYNHILSETQMWQVSLLLKSADQPLPDPVLAILAR